MNKDNYEKFCDLLSDRCEEGVKYDLGILGQCMADCNLTKADFGVRKLSDISAVMNGAIDIIKADETNILFTYTKSKAPNYDALENTIKARGLPGNESAKQEKAFPYYALATINKLDKEKGGYTLKTLSNERFYLKKETLERFAGKKTQGDLIWCVQKLFNGKPSWQVVNNDVPNIPQEILSIKNNYRVGDTIWGMVKRVSQDTMEVLLGPSFSRVIPKKGVRGDINFSTIKEGEAYAFEITELISKSDNAIKIELQPQYGHAKLQRDNYLSRLAPDDLSYDNFMIVEQTLERMRSENGDIVHAVESALGGFDRKTLVKYIDEKYKEQLNDHSLIIGERSNKGVKEIHINVDLDIKTEFGVELYAFVNRKVDRDKFFLSMIGAGNAGQMFERYIWVPEWSKVLRELSELALEERWDYSNENNEWGILKNYLKFTYHKAKLDNLITEYGGNAIFNTGLADKLYDDIYCWLIPNTDINDPMGRKWTIKSFSCVGRGAEGKLLSRTFPIEVLPEAPRYINMDSLEDLVFDVRKGNELLACDYEHVIVDNLDRLPRSFIRRTLSDDDKLRDMIDNGTSIGKLRAYIDNNENHQRKLQQALKSAIEVAIKRCKWNYKTAVPVYYPRKNSLSLLLPLSLNEDSKADIALVVAKVKSGNYQGETILTLDMAYQDARQICRPDSDWLSPEGIENSSK